jgi:uncharacterized protein YprB with RNaseH-like and TPR domain
VQEYLDLVEGAGKLVFFDIESTGLRGDYNSVLCVSFKPYGKQPYTLKITKPGNDQGVVIAAKKELEKYSVWCGYYSKGFDIPMLNTRLLRWHQQPIDKRMHLDMYYALKYSLLTARKSQGHLLSWLGTVQQKQSVSASTWSDILGDVPKYMPEMISRCESDVRGLEALYKRTRHVVRDLKR